MQLTAYLGDRVLYQVRRRALCKGKDEGRCFPMSQLTVTGGGQGADPKPAPAAARAASGAQAATVADLDRVKYGAWLVLAAFVLLAVVFAVAVTQFKSASDVTAVVGSVATVVGTIIGAFFGVQAGSSGKAAAEAGRTQAEQAARIALAKLDPAVADQVMHLL